jgi:hypothetical protein
MNRLNYFRSRHCRRRRRFLDYRIQKRLKPDFQHYNNRTR